MAGKFNDTEQLFIREVLDQHGEYLLDLLGQGIEDKELIVSGDLLDRISYQVKKEGNDYHLLLSFYSHGRFIEIRYHKRKSANSKLLQQGLNNMLWGKRESIESRAGRRKKKKNTDWYTRNVYGAQNRLIGRLMYDLTDDVIARLKEELIYMETNGQSLAEYKTPKYFYQ